LGLGELDVVKCWFGAGGSLKPGAGALADPYGRELDIFSRPDLKPTEAYRVMEKHTGWGGEYAADKTKRHTRIVASNATKTAPISCLPLRSSMGQRNGPILGPSQRAWAKSGFRL
jgi:hypothetical protein